MHNIAFFFLRDSWNKKLKEQHLFQIEILVTIQVGLGDMAKKIITIIFFISVDIDNYHDKCHLYFFQV